MMRRPEIRWALTPSPRTEWMAFTTRDFLAPKANETSGGLFLEGYAAVFESEADLGPFFESFERGAFRNSLDRGDEVVALVNHDPNLVLARYVQGRANNNLELEEDKIGLNVRIRPTDTQYNRDLVKQIRKGDLYQMSIGFFIDDEELIPDNGGKPHYKVKAATLFDVSVVTFPAYGDTQIEARKGAKSESSKPLQLRGTEKPQAQSLDVEARARQLRLMSLR